MTLEEWVGMTADQLDKFSEQELHEHFQKYFPVTRPELAQKVQSSSSIRAPRQYEMPIVLTDKQKKAIEILKAQGLNEDEVMKIIRKKAA